MLFLCFSHGFPLVFLCFSYKPRPVSCDTATVAQLVHAPLGEEGDIGELWQDMVILWQFNGDLMGFHMFSWDLDVARHFGGFL